MRGLVALLLLSLSACTLWDFVKPNPGLSVDTEIVAGDKQQEVATGAVVGRKENTTNTAEQISYHTVNEAGTDYWLFLIALAGWIAPSPRQIWLMIKRR